MGGLDEPPSPPNARKRPGKAGALLGYPRSSIGYFFAASPFMVDWPFSVLRE